MRSSVALGEISPEGMLREERVMGVAGFSLSVAGEPISRFSVHAVPCCKKDPACYRASTYEGDRDLVQRTTEVTEHRSIVHG